MQNDSVIVNLGSFEDHPFIGQMVAHVVSYDQFPTLGMITAYRNLPDYEIFTIEWYRKERGFWIVEGYSYADIQSYMAQYRDYLAEHGIYK